MEGKFGTQENAPRRNSVPRVADGAIQAVPPANPQVGVQSKAGEVQAATRRVAMARVLQLWLRLLEHGATKILGKWFLKLARTSLQFKCPLVLPVTGA